MKSTKKTWSVHILTLFPEMFPGPLNFSLAGKALNANIWSLNVINLRDFAKKAQKVLMISLMVEDQV